MARSIEDKIRLTVCSKLTIRITGKKRSATGYTVTIPGKQFTAPSRSQALTMLYVMARCSGHQVWAVTPTKTKQAK